MKTIPRSLLRVRIHYAESGRKFIGRSCLSASMMIWANQIFGYHFFWKGQKELIWWSVGENGLRATFRTVGLQGPFSGSESFETRHVTTLRLEEPEGIALSTLETKLLAIIKDALETIF